MSKQFKLPLLDLIGPVIHDDYVLPYIDTGQILVNPAALLKSAIIISSGFVKSDSINVVLYFHGYGPSSIEQYLKSRKFKDIIDASKKSFVFIAPQLGSLCQFVTSAADSIAYLNGMLDMLVQYGPYTTAPKIKNLILAAHSHGGFPMLSATGWLKDFSIKEAWLLDCLYGPDDPIAAPQNEKLFDKTSVDQWKAKISASVEMQWFNLAKGGLSLKVYWGNGGTLTRTSNLDLLDHLDQTSSNIEMHPEFYECPTTEKPVLIKPTPSPRSQHDPLPQTVLAECIRNCRFL